MQNEKDKLRNGFRREEDEKVEFFSDVLCDLTDDIWR